MGLTGFVIIPAFIASFSPAQGEHNQMVNAKFTRPVNAMPMSNPNYIDQTILPILIINRIDVTHQACQLNGKVGLASLPVYIELDISIALTGLVNFAFTI